MNFKIDSNIIVQPLIWLEDDVQVINKTREDAKESTQQKRSEATSQTNQQITLCGFLPYQLNQTVFALGTQAWLVSG